MSGDSATPPGPEPVSGKLEGTFSEDSLSNLRHSLRTPLNQILGYSEMIEEELVDLGRAGQLPDLRKIHTAGQQLLALINEGLASWRVELGKLEFDSLRREMRTPLNVVVGYSELCQEEAEENNLEAVIPDLQRINTAAKSLGALFDSKEFSQLLLEAQQSASAKVLSRADAAAAIASGTQAPRSAEELMPATPRFLDARLLVVDDNPANVDMLARRLAKQGYTVSSAENGRKAIDLMRSEDFDLVLLDILMPELNGFETLQQIKSDETLRSIPVIMLSALDEIDSAVKCIEIGAEDYLPKPFNPVVLNARINASLEKKRLREQEQAYLRILQDEREKSEKLLLNILPKSIADRLKQGENTIADSFPEATVLFADLVGFTRIAAQTPPAEVVQLLNDIFSQFDWLAYLHGLEKIKTIGDAYMAVAGVPVGRPDHADAVVNMAMDMQKVMKRFELKGTPIRIRVGISTGPVVAGVIGKQKFIYDLWGDTVNVASRMESHGQSGEIQLSESTYQLIKDRYEVRDRGSIEVKGRGQMNAYFLVARRAESTVPTEER